MNRLYNFFCYSYTFTYILYKCTAILNLPACDNKQHTFYIYSICKRTKHNINMFSSVSTPPCAPLSRGCSWGASWWTSWS